MFPNFAVAEIVTVPAVLAVTRPVLDTVATVELLLVHSTPPSALFGTSVAVSRCVLPTESWLTAEPIDMPVGMITDLTVMVRDAVLFPVTVFAVIVTVPAVFAVTKPVLDTSATFVLLLDHVTLWPALSGLTSAVN